SDADRVSRFQREAEVLASLNHPNIAGIHDLAETNGSLYLVLELVEGETLADRISRGPIPVDEALSIAIQICDALEDAHECGVIHRDLKPANVKLTPDGKVKVLDFGLAKLSEQRLAALDSETPTIGKLNTDPGTVLGTASYMSPEQARGQEVDARTDIFSLGVVFYEMFAGRPPFEGVGALDVISAILQKEPAPLRQYLAEAPPELENILIKTLRKDRGQRYHTARDLLIALKDLREELAFA